MTAAEHYREAERHLNQVRDARATGQQNYRDADLALLVAIAQVHATLATAGSAGT